MEQVQDFLQQTWLKISQVGEQEQEVLLLSILKMEDKSEEVLKGKENALNKLAQLYCKQNQPTKIQEMIEKNDFNVFTTTRAAKIIRQMIDQVATLQGTIQIQIQMCHNLVDWCTLNKKTYLRHKLEIRLATLYHQVGKYSKGIEIIERIVSEVRKADDKHLLLEIYLIESKLQFGQTNIAKAKASLTAARACSNTIYCHPQVQADIDLMGGILYAEERDYRTAYSYFYEAFEAFNNLEDSRAASVLKYMLLCKIMSNSVEEVNQLLIGKYGLKYAGRNLDAMKSISNSNSRKSLIEFTKTLENYHEEIEGDSVIKLHIESLYQMLLEKNLFQVILPYSRVQIDYITQRMQIDTEIIQRKLSELILDHKIEGTLDQGNNCLILFDTSKHDDLYKNSIDLINNLNGSVDKLFERIKKV